MVGIVNICDGILYVLTRLRKVANGGAWSPLAKPENPISTIGFSGLAGALICHNQEL